MELDKYIQQLVETESKSEYVTLVNSFFELFVETYRKDYKRPLKEVIPVKHAFKQLGAESIDTKWAKELNSFRQLRNRMIHNTVLLMQTLEDMKRREEDFVRFMIKYAPLLSISTEHLDFLLQPLDDHEVEARGEKRVKELITW